MTETSRSITRVKGFNDAEMDFQLLRQLGTTSYGGSSVGETLSCASKIPSESAEDWVNIFSKLAEKQELDAITRLNKQHFISSSEQFLKAANSYRSVEYFIHSSKPEHKKYGLRSRECFINYLKLTEFNYVDSFINYKNQQLPYYLISPTKDKVKRKTIVIVSGFDGTLEESFISYGIAAIKRGYTVVCFAGPGQMDAVRFNEKTFFEPDFEKPISSLLDELESKYNDFIEFNKLSLMGISFGGYFASRATCYEPRIKALIANSPIVDLYTYILGFAEDQGNNLEDFSYNDIPYIPDEVMPPSLKEQAANLMLRFGKKLMSETGEYLQNFTISETTNLIKCPTLALIGNGEGGEPLSQYDYFIKNVQNISSYKFTVEDGADTHCQVTNLGFANCVVFDWLDETLI
jgi:pimeloyl-ACP methyl ester carboxylesterase